jgi:hypothetical protein
MKIYSIICGMLDDFFTEAAKASPHEIKIDLIDKKLHTEPEKLKKELQLRLDALKPEWDFIVLGLGLCGGALNGLKSGKHTVIIPRCHDCISLFLGSKDKYEQAVKKYQNRCYWFTPSFYKQGFLLIKKFRQQRIEEYTEQYDDETAEYLINVELEPLKHYTHLNLIDDFKNPDLVLEEEAKELALEFNWQINKFNIDNSLFYAIYRGNYDNDMFLTVPPGKMIVQSMDSNKIIEAV